MVGVWQQANAGPAPSTGVLLCRPLGQEATRTAAMYRVISDRLSRENCIAFRFDYHGTSDSPGEEGDQSLDLWVQDTLAARAELATARCATECWFAMGLGANIALRAAETADQPPARLVLWEPASSGAAYIEDLLAGHRAELEREFQSSWARLLEQGKVSEPTLPGDLLGFHFGPSLATELQGLSRLDLGPVLRRGVEVVCGLHPDQQELMQANATHPRLSWHHIETRTDWMSSQAQGAAIVPPDVLHVLLERVR